MQPSVTQTARPVSPPPLVAPRASAARQASLDTAGIAAATALSAEAVRGVPPEPKATNPYAKTKRRLEAFVEAARKAEREEAPALTPPDEEVSTQSSTVYSDVLVHLDLTHARNRLETGLRSLDLVATTFAAASADFTAASALLDRALEAFPPWPARGQAVVPGPLETIKRKRAGSHVSVSDGDSDGGSINTVASAASPIGVHSPKVAIPRIDDDDGDTIAVSHVPPRTGTGIFKGYARRRGGGRHGR